MPKFSEERKKEMLIFFKKYDKDNSGFLDRKELRLALNELNKFFKEIGLGLTIDELEDMMNKADKNGDGRVDYNEFINIQLVSLL